MRELGNSSRKLHTGRPTAHDDESEQCGASQRIRLAFGTLEREQDLPTDRRGVLQRLQSRRARLPLVMSEIGMPGSGCQHQRVVCDQRAVCEMKLVRLSIDAADGGQQRGHLLATPEQVADRPGNLGWRERRGCDLIEQRLEQVMISLIDKCYANRRAGQTARDFQTTESSADNDDVMALVAHRRLAFGCIHELLARFERHTKTNGWSAYWRGVMYRLSWFRFVSGSLMAKSTVSYEFRFSDFQSLQRHMVRRVFARNRTRYVWAFFGVVLCAVFIVVAVLVNIRASRVSQLYGMGYSNSVLIMLILALCAAIISLTPAIALRLKTLRMQVTDDGPLLCATSLELDDEGVTVSRPLMKTMYRWKAFQGVELSNGAIVLPVDSGIGLIIPSSAFSSDSARYDFVAALSRHIEAAKVGTV